MSEQFLAQAQVLVTPNTKGFRAQLLADLEASTKNVRAKILVRPDMKGFQTELREMVIASTRSVVARVRVRPEMTSFRTELRREVAAASAGVVAGAVATGGATGGAGATAGAREQTLVQQQKAADAARLKSVRQTENAILNQHEKTFKADQRRIAEQEAFLAKAVRNERRTLEAAAASTGKARAAFTTAAGAASAGFATSSQARKGLKATTEAVVAAEKAFDASLLTTNRALQSNNAQLILSTRALEVRQRVLLRNILAEEAATAESLRGAAARQRDVRTGLRGFGAQLAAFAGLRGATLAASSTFIAGTVAAVGFGKAVKTAVDLQTELNVFAAATGASAAEMEAVSTAAKALGRDLTLPGVNASDAAQAMSLLARAGLSVRQSMDAVRGVLQLSTAAELDNAEAVRLTASALNAFGLAGTQAVRVADLLTNASLASQAEISDMGIALQQSSAVARQAGISLGDTVAMLSLLAKNGLAGSDAGTALRVGLTRLNSPTKKATELLSRLNIELRDTTTGAIRPEVFAEIAAALRTMGGESAQAKALFTIFGQDAQRVASILGREGVDGLRRMQIQLDKTGSASELATARTQGLAGSAENAVNQLSALGLTIGEKAIPALQAITDTFAELVSGINIAIEKLGDFEAKLDELPGSEAIQGFIGDLASGTLDSLFGPLPDINEISDRGDKIKQVALDAGADFRSGIEDAAREGVQGAVSFGDVIVGGINSSFAAIRDALRLAQKNIRTDRLKDVAGLTGQQAGLQEQLSAIIAGGGTPQAQISNLRRQAARLAKIIARAGKNAAGVLLEARRQAQQELASVNGQIKSLQEQVKSDQQTANEEADQAVIDAFAPSRRRLDTREALAEGTEGLRDNISVARARKKQLLKEIASINDHFLDRKQAADEIHQRRVEIIRLDSQIKEDTQELFSGGVADEIFAARLSLAEAEGNIPQQIKLISQRIAAIDRLIKAKKAEGKKLLELKTEEANLRAQREELQDQQREEKVALGESILDLTGNKNPLLRALNAQIVDTKADIKAAKEAGKSTVVLQTELNNLLIKRREVLEDASDKVKKEGTTAFDLLSQFVGQFNDVSGNTIGSDQPFVGPTGFVSDISKFLVRKPGVGAGSLTPAPGGKTKFELNDDRLVRSLDRLADVVERTSGTGGSRNGSTVSASTTNVDRLYQLHYSRETREAMQG